MQQTIFTTPAGMQDLLFEESRARRQVEKNLTDLFAGRGFAEVMTPGMEFARTVAASSAAMPEEELYKLTDTRGRLLVARPDNTIPIARMVASRLRGEIFPVRLYYAQTVYTLNHGLYGHRDEEFQVGVELLGAGGAKADLEMIALAASAMKACEAGDFRLEIGHADVFNSLIGELPVSDDDRATIRELIENKNYAALNTALDALPESDAVRAIRLLPRLFGGEEVLETLRPLIGSPAAVAALDSLSSLYRALVALGLGDQLMIDLGMVHRNDYYTGVIFRGYLEGSGEIILSGGRYDNLLSRYGMDMPAIGFAIHVDSVAKLRQSGDASRPVPQVLIHAEAGFETAALAEAEAMLADGVVCEVSPFETTEQARAYAESRGISRLWTVGEEGNE
ncbi:MAG: ATP phosphoribosyltransferase regulatory subunit [Clostridia bacterium]|nr:ATP phosphoribosyltransferase regulatory subunit [Clostridia bacterium]MBQ2940124.1 ATP phosphoribosyltransferase regulatory subunit [Clostridia bacterium]